MRTFLQVAAGAADIPVTRLLGQSPAGLSATGDSDTRNYYDMIAARQAIDLRPQLERLDRFLLASAGVAPDTLRFDFRPLWQMDPGTAATVTLQKAQATQIYAGLGLWPAEVMAGLVAGQLAEDKTYPNAGAVLGEAADGSQQVKDFNPDQPRDPQGRWTNGSSSSTAIAANAQVNSRRTPQAPDGTPISLASSSRRGRARALVALIGGAAKLVQRLSEYLTRNDPNPPEPIGSDINQQAGLAATPTSKSEASERGASGKKFTPEETAGLNVLFSGGGNNKSVEGAQQLLKQLDEGDVQLPPQVTRDVLERYAKVAQKSIDDGIDKLGVQALRLRAINKMLGR